jgi:hypothetical protein
MHRWAIEFRSGNYLQRGDAKNSGPAHGAQKFSSRNEAEDFMDTHQWIAFNGGMAVPLKDG